MITAIRLRNFRQHAELDIRVGAGLTSIIGPNANGKTNTLRAVLYALFGTSATGAAKEHLWRRDRPAKAECYVELDIILPLHGAVTVRRTASNATVHKDGVLMASGNTPVTAFVEEAMGMDAKTLRMLIYSPQGESQAMLAMGAAALQKRVEEIAKINVLQKVLDLLGTDVSKKEGELDGIGEVPNLRELEDAIAKHNAELLTLSAKEEAKREERIRASMTLKEADTAYREAMKVEQKRAELRAKLSTLTDQAARVQEEIGVLRSEAERLPECSPDDLVAWEVKANAARTEREELNQKLQRHGFLTDQVVERRRWLAEQGPRLAQSRAAQARVAELSPTLAERQEVSYKARTAAGVIRGKLSEHRHALQHAECPTCHREYEAGAKASVEAAISALVEEEQEVGRALALALREQTEVEELMQAARSQIVHDLEALISDVTTRLDAHEKALHELDVEGAEPRLDVLQEAERLATEEQSKLTTLLQRKRSLDEVIKRSQVAKDALEGERLQVTEELATFPEELCPVAMSDRLDALATCVDGIIKEWQELSRQVQASQSVIRQLELELDRATKLVARRKALEADVAERKELQKYLRTNRAKLGQETWEGLLGYASYLVESITEGRLSNLRRTDAGDFVVQEGGFDVPVGELSGAQRSIVGISIRIALSKVFFGDGLPLMLDEATADCSDETAAAIAGMLQGLKTQILSVTHRTGDAVMGNEVIAL